ncbi:MAG: hypothetical protein Kow0077_09580 [Anaerolineae bacterium]
MSQTIGAVVMVGGSGTSAHEQLVQSAIRASALDLIRQLQQFEIAPIVVASPSTDWCATLQGILCEPDPPERPFHFGRRLAELIEAHQLDTVFYFGGGSAPLLDNNLLTMAGMFLEQATQGTSTNIPLHIALTNNYHSSDWVAFSRAQDALPIIREADRDNSLAWLLAHSGLYDVRVLTRMRPAAGLDLDTPSDLAVVAQHPEIKPALAAYLKTHDALSAIPVQPVLQIAATAESHLTLIGRVSPQAWQALNKVTQCWIRVYAEERGMVASGRLARGEVKSLPGELIKTQGAYGFFRTLSNMTDAAIIDSRPLMAAAGIWPEAAQRFASDLFDSESIADGWLKDFTLAAREASIPILLGGHSVVAGGIFVLAEIIEQSKASAR